MANRVRSGFGSMTVTLFLGLLVSSPASAISVGDFLKQPSAQRDKTLAATRDALLKKIFAALLSRNDSHGNAKTEEMRKADEQTALFIQKVATHLSTTDFVAEVAAESSVEPDVELEKVFYHYIRLQLQAAEAARSKKSEESKQTAKQ